MNDRDANFFRPLWLRLLITGVLVVWFVLELLLSHEQIWIAMTGIGVVYCVWNFFLRFPKAAPPAASEAIAPADPAPKP